ncbi:MAG: adenosylmethionine decarboxylase [bacterium]|nr:adenosylmethionine decarboxylase [bacterium]
MQNTKRVPRWTNALSTIAPKFAYTGIHVVADFWNGKTIKDKKELEMLLYGAAKAASLTPLKLSIYKFNPQGITGVILLAESHIAVHTWPEIGYVAVDIFTCGKKAQPKKALKFFEDYLEPMKMDVKEIKRGVVKGI